MSSSFQTAATPFYSARPLTQTSAASPRGPQAAAGGSARPHREGCGEQAASIPGRVLGFAPRELMQVSCTPVPANQTLRKGDPEPLPYVPTGLWAQGDSACDPRDPLQPGPCALLGLEPPSSATLAGTTPWTSSSPLTRLGSARCTQGAQSRLNEGGRELR